MSYSTRSVAWAVFLALTLALAQVSPARAASLPAEINKQFTPLQIDTGGVSVLKITIFNPNVYALSSVAFNDNLVGVQLGLFIASGGLISNTCGGSVTATPGTNIISLSGGSVPAQTTVPGQCSIEVAVSSLTEGNLINTIPAGELTATGAEGPITNTSPASATISVIAVDPPSMSKTFNPNTIYVGDVSQMTIRINNNDPDTNLTNVSFTDNLPPGLKVATPPSASMTGCGAGATLSALADATSISLSGGTVTPTTDCIIRVNVTGDAGEHTNTIPAGPAGPGSLQTQQGVTNNTPVSADLNIQPVDIQKAFAPAAIDAGDTSVLTITLQNPTNSPYTGAHLLDTMPAGLTVLASPVPTTTCGSGIVTIPASNQIELTGGVIPARPSPSALGTCTITATVRADLTASGVLTNQIPPGDFTANGGAVTNISLVQATLNVTPALTGTKSFAAPYAIALNGLNLVTITLTNNSSTPFTDVDFSDTMPAGLTIATTTTTPAAPSNPATTCGGALTYNANTVTLANGGIGANSSCTVTFYVTSNDPAGSPYENAIPPNAITACTASAICVGNGSGITTGTDLTVINANQLPLEVDKFFNPSSSTGSGSRVTITITAPLDIGVNGIQLTDTLPAGVTVSATPSVATTCPGGVSRVTAAPGSNQIIFANLGSDPLLAAGTSCTISVNVSAGPGRYINDIPINAITTAQGRTNELDSASATLNLTSMTMRKAFYPDTVQADGKSTLTITLENTAASPLKNLSLTDILPGSTTNGIVIANPSNVVTTCEVLPGEPATVAAVPGTQNIQLTNGTIPAQVGGVPGICTITLDVQGKDSSPSSSSSYTNTIPTNNVSATVGSFGPTIYPLNPANASLTIRNLKIGVVKGFDPVLVYGGATSTMTVRLINPNSTTLTGISFTDNMASLGSGIILADPPMFNTGTCGGTLTGLPGASSFSFSGGILYPNRTCELTLRVVMNVNGNRTNRIPAGAVTTFNGVSSDQPTEASLTNLPGLSVVKMFNPNPVTIGQASKLTITISNTSNVPVVNMGLLDNFPTLPNGLVVFDYVSTPSTADDPVNNCTDTGAPATLTATPGANFIQLTGGSLQGKGNPTPNPHETCFIEVFVVSPNPGAFENIIPVGGVTADGGVQNNNPGSDILRVGGLYSLGNRVWLDTDNDGTIDANEVGVDNVTVQLYSADGGGNPIGSVRRTQITDQGGYYRFDDLEPGDYVVVIPASQFAAGAPLAGYWSSGTSINAGGALSDSTVTDPDNDVDSDENGVTQTSGAFSGAVISRAVTLGPGASEPTNDDDEPLANPFGESPDAYSNRTVDFGFYRVSVGNLIFLDSNANGAYNGGEAVIPGATVQLFASNGTTEINVGPDGILGTADDAPGGTLSDADGTYLFDGLTAGAYVIKVTPPAGSGYTSTVDTADTANPNLNVNNNDNGVGTAGGQVSSAAVTLTPGSPGAQSQNAIDNATGSTYNPTMDFGFLLYSLGNRVWFDTNNNSVIDGAEVGVSGVYVTLYRDDGDGVYDAGDTYVGYDITDSNGYYRFDDLPAGDYVVVLPNDNFTSGGGYSALAGYWSSGTLMNSSGVLSDSTVTDPDNDTDSDDNGITSFSSAFIGDPNPINYVSSLAVTLGGLPAEPTGETAPNGQGTIDNHANMTADFGFYRTAIGDLVFVNASPSGIDDGDYDSGIDLPLAGAVVTLYAGDGATQIPTGSDGILGVGLDNLTGITTVANGLYAFSGLPAGDYVVKVTPPAGYSSMVDTAAPADTADPDVNVNNNDNGIGTAGGQVSSGVLTMSPATETLSATITRTDATGVTTDTSVDFGFISPTYSLGNRVWYDTNNNGFIDTGETGIANVAVRLYQDTNLNGVYNVGDTLIASTTTDASGYYRFDNLAAGEYIVMLPTPPAGYWSSGTRRADVTGVITDTFGPDPDLGPDGSLGGGDDDRDIDDNGITTFTTPANPEEAAVSYVSSAAVTLGPGSSEPIDENDPTAPFWQGTGDNHANMTVDFGFYRTRIGDLVFVDNNNNGIYNGGGGGDVPLQGATVQLFTSDGSIQIGANVTTPAAGTYSFQNLPEGNYVVKVTPPIGYSSAIDTAGSLDPDSNVNNDDNGIGTAAGIVVSSSGTLTMNPGADVAKPNRTITPGNTTDNTVDFGFVPLRFSLGNRVWFDTNDNGAMDAGEVGVSGVRVELYQDTNNDNVPDGASIGFATTDASGYYRFDNLLAGNYIVRIPADNFRDVGAGDTVPGDPLRGYWSSGTTINNAGVISDSTSNDPDGDADLDDNGRTTLSGSAISYVTAYSVTLGPGNNEPTTDNDPATNPEAGEQVNNQSNRTVDFGFYRTQVGNLVFLDNDGSGHYNAGDTPIANALVRLYAADNAAEIITGADGIPGTEDDGWGPDGAIGGGDDNTGGIRTDAGGNYLFAGLPAGDYIIKVDTPAGLISTVDAYDLADNNNPDVNTDNNDNGEGEGAGLVTSDVTNRLTTTPGSTGAQGNNTVAQASGTTTDPTVDFGFVLAYSVGNRVWYDSNNDGVLNADESGIPGARVELFRDTNNDNVPDGASIGFAVTDANGYYRFDNLPAGNYTVVIPADNFRNVGAGDTVPGDPLRGYWSSGTTISAAGVIGESATNDPDNDRDAFNGTTLTSDENGRTVFSGGSIDYVIAYTVTLGASAEPLNDNDPLPNPAATLEAPNERSNRTVDFGFYQTAIGNLVFYDTDSSGHYNAGDTPIANVLVHLYAANNVTEIITGADGIPGTADDGWGPDGAIGGGDDGMGGIRTNAGGNYLFSGLPQGSYIVKADAPTSESRSTIDSNPQTDNDDPNVNTDNNDNGVGAAGGTVSSNLLVMNPGIDAAKPNRTVSNGVTTDNTLDFGFVEFVAIGNRIWFDIGAGAAYNNGILDGGEVGVPNGVVVELRRSSDNSLVATTTTTTVSGSPGYYLFDNLVPGSYYVQIPASEFALGRPLYGYVSSLGNGAAGDNDDHLGANGDENGIDANPLVNGIRTPDYNLQPNTAPTADDDTGYTGVLDDNNVNFTADFGFTQLVAIGNRVWFDIGGGGGVPNDGIQNGSEAGASGVTVELYRQGGTIGTPYRTTVTDASGNYFFDNLNPGNYFVHIPASMFDATAPSPLQGFLSSTGAGNDPLADQNVDENGIDAPNLAANGISSRVYNLQPNNLTLMPTGEPQTGYGGYLDDDNVNATADFGFLNIVAIGNRVWYDNGASGGTANNGIQDGAEPGVNGVTVELYLSTQTPGVDTPVRTTTTDGTGYYVFDNLLGGTYVVHIPAINFAPGHPLYTYYSTDSNGTDETTDHLGPNGDENGIDQPNPAVSGITSTPYTLSANTEPTSDDDTGYSGVLDDDDVNFTADFGFTQRYALGNRVWYDTNNNALMDSGEAGVNGVLVELYRANASGDPTGSAIASDVTANGGFYLFDNIGPGEYVVVVAADNFNDTGAYNALVGYWSSLTTMSAAGVPTENPALVPDPDNNGPDGIANTGDDDIDMDDNGARTTLAGFNGAVISKPVTIGPDGDTEPTDETAAQKEPGVGDGSQPDGRSNLKVDFGFYKLSVGDLVFSDGNQDGTYTLADDAPLAGVVVHLFASDGATEIPVGADGVLGTSDDNNSGVTTNASGLYRFDGLPAGDYIIRVETPVGTGSTIDSFDQNDNDDPNRNTNNNDNGDNDSITPSTVSSNPVTLAAGPDITRPNNTVNNSDGSTHNPTLDFGFIPAFSLGNRVWYDTNNNGRLDAGETGINGVTLEVYAANAGGEPTGVALGNATTANGGYYLFNPLPAGNYVVVVTAANFSGVLNGYWSSGFSRNNDGTFSEVNSPDPDNDADSSADENGMHTSLAGFSGAVISKPVTLGPNPTEPTGEADLDMSLPAPHQGQPDNRGNMTVDFGFYTIRLGDLVWEDADNSGTVSAGEAGIPNVDVQLWTADGSSLLATQTTDGSGNYLFTGLPAGNYLLRIPAVEFNAGGTLEDYISSTGTNSVTPPISLGPNEPAPAPDANTSDSDDNGSAAGGTLGAGGYVQTSVFNLNPGGEASSNNTDGSTLESRVDFGLFQQANHTPLIGAAKRLVSPPVEVSPGTYQAIYDIYVQNWGVTPLDNVQVTDDLTATFPAPNTASVVSVSAVGLTVNTGYNGNSDTNLLAGTDTLAVGGSGTIRLTINVVPYAAGPFDNTAVASGVNPFGGATVTDDSEDDASLNPDPDLDNDPTNNNQPTPVDFGPDLFDPPIGFKVFDDSGLPLLQWTMIWINSTNIAAVNARVSDPIPAGTTYEASGTPSGFLLPGGVPAGSTDIGVSCTSPGAATTTTLCYYEGPTVAYPLGRVVWEGTIGPDFGNTTAAAAVNELYITFRVRVPADVNAVYNTASIDADRNGDRVFQAGGGGTPNEISVATGQGIWVRGANDPGDDNDKEGRGARILPSTGFAPNIITALPEQPAESAYFAANGIQVEIPKLGINTAVTGIPQAKDGTWDVTWLWNQAGWLQGTAYPATSGNSAITGHVYLPNGEPGIFVNLHTLSYGDKIILRAYGQKFTYEVRENKLVKPADITVLNRAEGTWVTLITCQGYNEASNSYASRVAVRAVLIKVEMENQSLPSNRER